MADLTLLQNVVLIIGGIGGTLGIINTVQSWRKNRPAVSVMPEGHAADRTIEITITNPGSRPITLTRSRCIRGPYSLKPSDYTLYVEDAKENDLHIVVQPQKSEKLAFIRARDGAFLLLIYWDSSAAFIFSLLPLFVFRTKRQVERLNRTRLRDYG